MAYTFATLNAAMAAATSNSDIATIIANIQSDMAASPSIYIPAYVAKIDEQLDQFSNGASFFQNFYFLNQGAAMFIQFGNLTPAGLAPPTPSAYKTYAAKLNQSGTGDPVATEFANDIGAIVWTRAAMGTFKATLVGAFTLNKTFVSINQPKYFPTNATAASFVQLSADVCEILTTDLSADTSGVITGALDDGILQDTCVEIRVYN